VIVLLGIGFLAGLVTSLSPCVLPVLPVLLAGGATGRRPLRIVAGLIGSFVVFTLFAAWLLRELGLPLDLLRNLALGLLFLVAATLLFPGFATALERPLAGLTRLRADGGGFLLGASLGLVFVPCAGPVLAAVTVVAANEDVGLRALALTLAYALGAAVPMALVAFGGRGLASRLRAHAPRLRIASGLLIGAAALAIALGQDQRFQTALPGYTEVFQKRVESSATARRELGRLTGVRELVAGEPLPGATAALPDYGEAPELEPDGEWFNSRPLSVRELRGAVVLLDFWTYSCINCLRTLPHLKAWDERYRADGLVILGVHTPEFAFEHEASNVAAAVERLGLRYPVLQDNSFDTWNAYGTQRWPAKYLVDRDGRIRWYRFGEGGYDELEGLLRRLLGSTGASAREVPNESVRPLTTPESYLGYARLARYAGSPVAPDREAAYGFPRSLPPESLAYDGAWRVEAQRIVAGPGARLRLRFHARHVHLVLGGKGRVEVLIDGKPRRTVDVTAYRLYTLRRAPDLIDGLLELRFTPGIAAYAFTFG
jgi:cytochrome c biogenesis protein CcdA/thiol-disulfide isomerase/thioredoxin